MRISFESMLMLLTKNYQNQSVLVQTTTWLCVWLLSWLYFIHLTAVFVLFCTSCYCVFYFSSQFMYSCVCHLYFIQQMNGWNDLTKLARFLTVRCSTVRAWRLVQVSFQLYTAVQAVKILAGRRTGGCWMMTGKVDNVIFCQKSLTESD